MSIDSTKEIIVQGIGISPGIAFGKLKFLSQSLEIPKIYPIPENLVESEKAYFKETIELSIKQLRVLVAKIAELSGQKEASILEAHIIILQDPNIIDTVLERIESRRQNAAYIFYVVLQNYIEAMNCLDDDYLKERIDDIYDLRQRTLKNFKAHQYELDLITAIQPDTPLICISPTLSPSEVITLNTNYIKGFITLKGSTTSHTAILARSLNIPVISLLNNNTTPLKETSQTIIDGNEGKLIICPSEETVAHYQKLEKSHKKLAQELLSSGKTALKTLDGRDVYLSSNLEFEHEFPLIQKYHSLGVGLLRTEFSLIKSPGQLLGEEEQFLLYQKLAQSSEKHPCIIRTLDAGGDKVHIEDLNYHEANPFLGWRGIRVSLSRVDIFKVQLKAILRASYQTQIAVMFPLISAFKELLDAKAILNECMQELEATSIPYNSEIPVGMMIEVPATVILAEEFSKEVDFFSIGTNDLIQYTTAVDRGNKRVSNLYNVFHPAIIRQIKTTVEASNKAGIWVEICGEAAYDLTFTPLLLGLGVHKLSVTPHEIPTLRQAISYLKYEDCLKLAKQALTCSETQEISKMSIEIAEKCYPKLLSFSSLHKIS